MARIKSYVQDTNITDQDRVLGSSYEGTLNNKPIYKTKNYKLTDLAAYFSQNFDFDGLNFNVSLLSETITANTQAIASANLSLSVLTTDVLAQATFQVNLAATFGTFDNQGNLLTLAQSFADQILQATSSTRYATSTFATGLASSFGTYDATTGEITAFSEAFADQVFTTTASTRFAESTALTSLEATVTTGLSNVNAAISSEQTARANEDEALAQSITTLETSVNTDIAEVTASITAESTARSTADTALANTISTLEASVDTDLASVNAAITAESTARSTADTALANTISTLESSVDTDIANVNAAITAEQTARASADSALAQDITTLTSTVSNNFTTLNAAITNESTTRINEDQALASDITSLTSTVTTNNTTLTAAVQTNASTIATVDGKLSASYGITVDAGGRVAGLKLLADGTTGSEFIARANTFAVDMPNGTRVLTVNSSGLSVVGSGTFSGNISGSSGTFNGVTINSSGITASNFSLTSGGLSLSNTGSTISIGNGVTINQFGISGVNFSLDNTGLSASNATISGNITITSGTTLNAITTAQGTADTAVNDASTAQGTANTAINNAATAQSTANTANTTANTALGRTVDAAGKIVFNPTPSGSGLFMNATNLGYYDGGSWKTYMQNNGNFFLSGSGSNGLSWDGTTLTVNGDGNFTGQFTAGNINLNNNIITVSAVNYFSNVGAIVFKDISNVTNAEIKLDVAGVFSIQTATTSGADLYLDDNGWFQIGGGNGPLIRSDQSNPNSEIVFSSAGRYEFRGNFPTTGTAANVYWDTADSGSLRRSTSSIRYKLDVQDYDKGIEVIKLLRPVYYKGINDGEKQFAGLIAEEVHEAGLTEFVQYNENDEPDALGYAHMVALLTKGIQEQQQQIDALKAEIELLKAQ